MLEIFGVISFVVVALLLSSLKIVREYERLVIFRLGHVVGTRGPGLQMVVPFFEHFVKMDLRVSTIPLKLHEVATRDDITVEVNANCLFQVANPVKLVSNLEDPKIATEQLVRSALADAIKQNDFEHLVQAQSYFLKRLVHVIDKQTARLGIRVTLIQLEDVKIVRKPGDGSIEKSAVETINPVDLELENEAGKVREELLLVSDVLEDKSSHLDRLDLVAPASPIGSEYQLGSHNYIYGHEAGD